MGFQHGDETYSGINVHADERSPESAGTLANNSNDVNCPLRLPPESNMEESTKSPHSTTSIEEPSTSSVVEDRATKTEGRDKPVLIVVMGVAGTGKTTLAKALVSKLQLPYIEGDDLHPESNIQKMSSGIPLTDADREPWLKLIREKAEEMVIEQHEARLRGEDTESSQIRMEGVLVTCSALKRYYRDILRGSYHPQGEIAGTEKAEDSGSLLTYFVYIKGDEGLLRDRMKQRTGHFMKPEMLDSQLATLESPEGEERVVVVSLAGTTEEQVSEAVEGLRALRAD